MGSLPSMWALDIEHRSVSKLGYKLSFTLTAISPAQVLSFSPDHRDGEHPWLWNTWPQTAFPCTWTLSHTYPRHSVAHTDDPSLSSQIQTHTAALSFPSITSCPFRPGRESRKQPVFEETPRAEASEIWVWIQGLETGSA